MDTKYANATAARQGEMPMFFGNTTNSFGSVIRRYIDKIFALGVDGVYHDEYGYSLVSFTYGTWDGHTAFLNPADLSIRALVGSLSLLSLELELEIQQIIKANHGFFTANGPPPTRSIIQGQFGVHFQEDSEHARVKHVQTYTPVMLNRDGGSQARDVDPKYNRGAGNVSGADPCWNILNHLDDGVLSYNCKCATAVSYAAFSLQRVLPFCAAPAENSVAGHRRRDVLEAAGQAHDLGAHVADHGG